MPLQNIARIRNSRASGKRLPHKGDGADLIRCVISSTGHAMLQECFVRVGGNSHQNHLLSCTTAHCEWEPTRCPWPCAAQPLGSAAPHSRSTEMPQSPTSPEGWGCQTPELPLTVSFCTQPCSLHAILLFWIRRNSSHIIIKSEREVHTAFKCAHQENQDLSFFASAQQSNLYKLCQFRTSNSQTIFTILYPCVFAAHARTHTEAARAGVPPLWPTAGEADPTPQAGSGPQ